MVVRFTIEEKENTVGRNVCGINKSSYHNLFVYLMVPCVMNWNVFWKLIFALLYEFKKSHLEVRWFQNVLVKSGWRNFIVKILICNFNTAVEGIQKWKKFSDVSWRKRSSNHKKLAEIFKVSYTTILEQLQ